mmetsp:Transcript_9223/g.6997  ORF Transcript_9223/g.6997 Transcript_9223/m.6997 type:complete len:100 (+) Transcript_9223:416-715(+)|eukprot:CAMPEP_0202956734 /NCGR_PEP_ID=MMETSP1396-20130829/1241_1 /ASSEMBLY_ACC=CAM_ASM_000872 /TAXON_ID= /ORGANISM="Pseudokeronopsis sp., Strain Brazil" /LENGTH=99 /DNA_ID=CAMNT_0049673899 /DNA_START=396 /DNA_END=695 /DNA_ORIENTATION=-
MKQLSEEDFRTRIREFEDRKRRKILELQEQYKDKDMEGCTFKPDLVTQKKKQAEKRALDQFIADQYAYLEKVKLKAEQARNQASEEKDQLQNPQIDKNS